jgi:hypothetical protein
MVDSWEDISTATDESGCIPSHSLLRTIGGVLRGFKVFHRMSCSTFC